MTICSLIIVIAEGRVGHQTLNQTTALLLFGWVFGVQLGLLENNLLTFAGLNVTQNSVIIICNIRVYSLQKTEYLVQIFVSFCR